LILLIDASNILAGGGKTHLVELLKHAEPASHGFDKVIVYGHVVVMKEIPPKSWLVKVTPALFGYGYFGRLLWKIVARRSVKNSIWFVPGTGSAPGNYVTMCQNLLPLESREIERYFFSITWIRLLLLRFLQRKAYRNAIGVIFLNQYSWSRLPLSLQRRIEHKAFIPHGISKIFRPFEKLSDFDGGVFRFVYVSTIDEYKHQWVAAKAIRELRDAGHNVSIDFVGNAYAPSLKRLIPFLGEGINYKGEIRYQALPELYSSYDCFILCSTCETFGMVLLEAMACGLPILCSNRSSMPETLKDNAMYFNPESIDETREKILFMLMNKGVLLELSRKGLNYVTSFTWKNTSERTFDFINQCAKQ